MSRTSIHREVIGRASRSIYALPRKYRKPGTRVRALVGTPVRVGVIVRAWDPYAQARVRWDDGTKTNIDLRDLEPE